MSRKSIVLLWLHLQRNALRRVDSSFCNCQKFVFDVRVTNVGVCTRFTHYVKCHKIGAIHIEQKLHQVTSCEATLSAGSIFSGSSFVCVSVWPWNEAHRSIFDEKETLKKKKKKRQRNGKTKPSRTWPESDSSHLSFFFGFFWSKKNKKNGTIGRPWSTWGRVRLHFFGLRL